MPIPWLPRYTMLYLPKEEVIVSEAAKEEDAFLRRAQMVKASREAMTSVIYLGQSCPPE